MQNSIANINKINKNVILVALYEIYDLPKSTLSSVINIPQQKIDEIKQSEEYKLQVNALKQVSGSALNIQELVENPDSMQVMILSNRFQLYTDLSIIVKKQVELLDDDLYQTKKHLVLQTIGILSNNLRALLQDMSKTATEIQLMKGGTEVGTNMSKDELLKLMTSSIGNED